MEKKKGILIGLLYVFFVLSGLTGLVYETLWTRKLSIIFGHTVFAVSSILAAFMGGLALGSYLAGRLVDRLEEPGRCKGPIKALLGGSFSPYIRLYGLLEVFVGLYALFTPFFIDQVGNAYVLLMRAFSLSLYPISIITFLLSLAMLALPTMAMGATLPIVLKFVIKNYGEIMEKTARIYAINTAGAVIGSFLAGFILFPLWGLKATLTAAAAANILIGLAAIVADRIMAASPGESPGKEPVPPPAQEKAPEEGESVPPGPGEDKARASLMRTVLLAFFISGFTSMVYQVCWSRALALSFGSSVYSFSTILVTFLSGIALGSFIFSHSGIFRQDRIKPSTLGDTELLIGVLSLAIMPFLGMMPFVFLKLFPLLQGSHWMLIAGNFLISFLVILPPTILIGVTFPMVLKIYTQDIQNLGRKTGEVYASNTTGNIVGSFMAGFVLIPVMGVENSLKLSVALNLLAAVMIYAASPSTKKTPAWILRHAVVIVSVVVLVFGQFWKHSAMSLGVSIYARHYAQVKTLAQFRSLAAIEASNIVYYRDGISSTVTVIHSGDLVGLKVNGKNDASYSPKGTDDMHTQWLQGFVPTLLHQNPKRVCVIGFGSGITCGAVSQFEGIEIIDSVEIEPVVMEAAKYFAEGNLNVVSSPAFRNHIADGRNFILASRKKYDVIISEPSNPWIAGIGNLFSTDFYRICLDRLEDDGVYCQWIQTYGMTPDTVKMVLNTFFSVFPRGSVWITQRGDLMLIGGKKDPVLDYQRLSEIMKKNPRVRDYMKLITYTSPRQLLAIRITDADRVRAFTAGSRINTDDLPFLEFEAPRNIYAEIDRMNIARSLMQYRPEGISFDWARNLDGSLMEDPGFYNDLGDVYSRLELWDQARELYRAAVAKSPAFGKAYVGWAWAEEKSKNPLRAVQVLREASRAVPRFEEAYLLRIDLLKRAGAFREGAAACREALKEMPESYVFLNQLVVMLIQDGDFKEALAPAEKLLALYPGAVPYQLYLARIFNGLGSPAKAEEAYRYILRGQPDNVIALDGLGDALASRKAWKEASEAYQAALKVSPGSIPTALKLAEAHEKAGLTDKARDVYFDILRQNPDVPQARMGLGRMSRQE